MTRWYWEQVGGTLVEEFPAVCRGSDCAGRWIDGVILPDGEKTIARASDISMAGKRVIAVQAKDSRIGMYLMGQALFSARLLRRFSPASIESVALCRAGDSTMEELLREFPEVRVVICPSHVRCVRADASEA